MASIDLVNDITNESNPPRLAFEKEAMDLPIRLYRDFKCKVTEDLPLLDEAEKLYISTVGKTNVYPRALFHKKNMWAYLAADSQSECGIQVAGTDRAELEEWLMELGGSLPEMETEEGTVQFIFWNASSHGGSNRYRGIEVEEWKEISGNYAEGVRGKIETLTKRSEDDEVDSGQLILWHGDPGTGKTHAIRALANEWSEWCDFHYITDPDQFFGVNAGYMIDVLLGHSEKWRCFVLEDSGELLSADAAQRSGQGLSRLLNTVDGLIGQGLKILVLVTTNEELGSLHAALSRPGRCLSQVEFTELSADESDAWLKAHDMPEEGVPYLLVDLYAKKGEHFEKRPEKVSFGFAS